MNRCTETKDSKISLLKGARTLSSLIFIISFILLGCGTAEQKVKRLQIKLGNEDPDVRHKAALSLAEIGQAASSAIPALINVLDDKDDIVRGSAALALSKIENPNAAPAIPKLIQILLGDGSEFARRSSLDALVSLKELAVPALIPLLASDNPETRTVASEALYRVGSEAFEATDVLIDGLYDSTEVVRQNAVRALKRIDTPQASSALDEYESSGIGSLLTRIKRIRKKVEMLDSDVRTEIEEQIANLSTPTPTEITPKDEFENQAMYKRRVEMARQKDREETRKYETEKEAIRNSMATRIEVRSEKYQRQLTSLRKEIILDETQFQFNLGKYDAEREVFPDAVVEVNESGIAPPYQWKLEIPLQQAKTFKQSVEEGKTSIRVYITIDHSNATAQISRVETVDFTSPLF